ncbi:Chlorophyllide a oxygenase, chloroplastic [Tetrabaena socialis]|uniref:Chlorophyllide a oxygenase, chloroplastic n=1 Tax=Tetrabaena socialis TaxID=47790 RepID=A0A2J7ZMX7_9CHLO|nr:Chlorophyllide a oxygenase, chloroplastic [Tetrabaena socialis]|eukprot:PNH01606.1 Chlorophyllide a oxygenase, chloroplastic [Tetrabaena socialis]
MASSAAPATLELSPCLCCGVTLVCRDGARLPTQRHTLARASAVLREVLQLPLTPPPAAGSGLCAPAVSSCSSGVPSAANHAADWDGAAVAGAELAVDDDGPDWELALRLVEPIDHPKGVITWESQSARRAKELADRRAYLQNFWYAAAISEKVTSKPIKVDILSRTVTIWRGEDGQVHCLDNVCPHRGAPLSGGTTKTKNGKSCVVCPYHGWAFNGQGALEDVPSQAADKAFPRRPLVDSYPVQERVAHLTARGVAEPC